MNVRALWKAFAPEAIALGLCLLAFLLSGLREPRFFDAAYLFDRSTLSTETALLALTMTLIVIAGHIDLSCTSALALVGAILATLSARAHVPFPLLIVLAPAFGALLGAVNGYLVAIKKLPSLVVTIATMALFRGAAQILLGDHSEKVPAWFTGIHRATIPKTYVPLTLVVVLIAAVVFVWLRHRSVFGRRVVAIGVNADAARHAAVPVERVVFSLFVASGAMAGLCALTLLSRLEVARFDHARGLELDVVTAVVLGGASIAGGRGTIFGSLVAVALLSIVQTGMGVAGVKSEIQVGAIGALLLLALALGRLRGFGATR